MTTNKKLEKFKEEQYSKFGQFLKNYTSDFYKFAKKEKLSDEKVIDEIVAFSFVCAANTISNLALDPDMDIDYFELQVIPQLLQICEIKLKSCFKHIYLIRHGKEKLETFGIAVEL